MRTSNPWPVLKSYDSNHIRRIALPLGGIGTGTITLGGRGNLQDFEISNRPAKGFTPGNSFFAIRVKKQGGEAMTRLLEGPLDLSGYEGATGPATPQHGWPRFRKCTFAAAYPFGQVMLTDPSVPVDVRIEAFNPLIPANADDSGIPLAVLRFVVTNKTNAKVDASIAGSLTNFIGADGTSGKAINNFNEVRGTRGLQGVFMQSGDPEKNTTRWGTMALLTTATSGISTRTAWAKLTWGDSLLDFWDDFSADGKIEERAKEDIQDPVGSVAVRTTLAPKASKSITFVIAWHFPNRKPWANGGISEDYMGKNHYATRFADAWDVAEQSVPRLDKLEQKTITFVKSFVDSDLPAVAKEAALFNLSTLRTETCFRMEGGRFFGWEGCYDKVGSCAGSCEHVWNYEHATGYLFGSLARSMRDTEFAHAITSVGSVCNRVSFPMEDATQAKLAAADGQMGILMRLYREWKLSGDDEFLKSLWPNARRAMEFCWLPGSWDEDQDGMMEGCQHNTMDVEYYGPNPQMTGWYLGALRACETMARHLGENDFADKCRKLFESGSKLMDGKLFNGKYYEHHIVPPAHPEKIIPNIKHGGMGSSNLEDPDLQLGAGCLVDQLVGQYTAHILGLGYLHDRKNIHQTLSSLMKYNFKTNLWDHFNHLRTFALGDESAMLMASYPLGRRPKRPFPYYNEVMTGFEYSVAVLMVSEGRVDEGLKLVKAIRDRYDGNKRSPFDEAECGHHYARAMASWALVPTLTGFQYDGSTHEITFAASKKPTTWFWSNGDAWGTVSQKPSKKGTKVELNVLGGSIAIQSITLRGTGTSEYLSATKLGEGKSLACVV